MADNDELSGRIVRIDKNFANISVSGRDGIARLDTMTTRRITRTYIADLPSILEKDARLKVWIVPMSENRLSQVPQRYRETVKKKSKWEVKFFRKDIEPAPQPLPFNVPERHFEDSGVPSDMPRNTVGRIISALLQIVSILNDTSLSKILPLVKSHSKVKNISGLDRYFGKEADLKRFILCFPQYFSISSSNVKRCCGFSDEVFNAALTKKALEINPPSIAGRSSNPTRQAASASAVVDPVDFKDVLSCTEIIESVEECNRVLDPILDKSTSMTRETVIGLDCEGVQLGSKKGCLTLVQISTWEGKSFLFDAYKNPKLLEENSSLKKILEHNRILKVVHDCIGDTYSLYHGFGVNLKNVFDTSIAMLTLMEQLNRYCSYRIGLKALCKLLGEGASHKDDEFVKKMVETPDFWTIRPLTEEMIFYAASDALCLVPRVYLKLNGMLTLLWRDLFTWSCKDTMENIQKRRQRGNRQVAPGSSPSSHRRHPGSSSLDSDDDDDDNDGDF